MIKNERGNSLITVLLVSLVFTVIGMAIVASSISGAKRTETRESDISITYDSIKLVDKMTSDLAKLLNEFYLDSYRTKDSENKLEVANSFDSDLHKKLFSDLIEPNKTNSQLECVNIIDLSTTNPSYVDPSNSCAGDLLDYDHFEIEKDRDFTRVFDIVLVTKNPIETEGKISRTITKRIILSPLPSFLKYAAGSDDVFHLNGSANFNGNIFANDLKIDKDAQYNLRDGTIKEKSTPLSSINGDIYSTTAKLLSVLEEDNFYKGQIPQLKHDSQFVNIEFDKTMNEMTNEVLVNSQLQTERMNIGSTFSTELAEEIGNLAAPSGTFNNCIEEEEEEEEEEENNEGDGTEEETGTNISASTSLPEGNCIKSDEEPIYASSLGIQGDLIVTSTNYPITLDNLTVDGDVYLESNASIMIGENMTIEGDLYVVSNQDVTIEGNVYVSGKTHLINFGGKLELQKNLISADTITIESHSNIKFNGDIVGGKDIIIKPLNSAIEINKNIFSNQSLTINGDDEFDSTKENDEVIFDSVVYAGKNANISNTNILGAENNEKQLILLAKDDLLMTRINEFNNYNPIEEDAVPYIPQHDNNIKPLKGFFYTEENAVLYGVGSLFYIEGGLFARETLTINAVRGEVDDINDLPLSQDKKFSRFIVNYDQDVMLKRIEALPIVDHLQIFSDELIVK